MTENWRRESDFLTTGEVAKFLNISRSTVARKFDKGAFEGKTNPITGERMIDRNSVTNFLERYGVEMTSRPEVTKRVVYVTSDPTLQALVESTFGHDSRIELDHLTSGCDTLVVCSREPTDLLLLDDDIADLPAAEVVKYARKASGDTALSIVLIRKSHDEGDDEGRQAAREQVDHEVFMAGLNEATLADAAFPLLSLPKIPIMDDDTHGHRRQAVRCPVHIEAKLRISAPDSSIVDDEGFATVDDISMSGVKVSNIRLLSGHVPNSVFRMHLEIDEEPLRDWHAECEVVRLAYSDVSLMAGLRFTSISDIDSHKVASLVRTAGVP